jgi:uncharacterized membrane protein (DUF4010 family)
MYDSLLMLMVAALCGAAVGVERQWSGHATGPDARFGGVRTFTLIGAVGGMAGRVWLWGSPALALTLAAGIVGVIAIAYASSSRRDIDATTEVAAVVVLASGIAAGLGQMQVASGLASATALLLFEKGRLHHWVSAVHDVELQAALRFAVMAAVILPLLPAGGLGPHGMIRPRGVWTLVLVFSAISFAGYIAQRVVGVSRGYAVTGLLGGLVSSTAVTLAFSRLSRRAALDGLAYGIVAANTVVYARVVVTAAVLSPTLAQQLGPSLSGAALVGVLAVLGSWWRHRPSSSDEADAPVMLRNPFQLWAAVQMALLFQSVLIAVALAERAGQAGLMATATLLGLHDVDALTVSMATRVAEGSVADGVAWRAVMLGVLSNTVVKLVLALTVARGRVRWHASLVLALMVLLLCAALVVR